MGISNEEFIEMSDASGTGVKLTWRIDGVEYGFATFGPPDEILKTLCRCLRSMLVTLYNKGTITREQLDNFDRRVV